jgi:hypothetical protein
MDEKTYSWVTAEPARAEKLDESPAVSRAPLSTVGGRAGPQHGLSRIRSQGEGDVHIRQSCPKSWAICRRKNNWLALRTMDQDMEGLSRSVGPGGKSCGLDRRPAHSLNFDASAVNANPD